MSSASAGIISVTGICTVSRGASSSEHEANRVNAATVQMRFHIYLFQLKTNHYFKDIKENWEREKYRSAWEETEAKVSSSVLYGTPASVTHTTCSPLLTTPD